MCCAAGRRLPRCASRYLQTASAEAVQGLSDSSAWHLHFSCLWIHVNVSPDAAHPAADPVSRQLQDGLDEQARCTRAAGSIADVGASTAVPEAGGPSSRAAARFPALSSAMCTAVACLQPHPFISCGCMGSAQVVLGDSRKGADVGAVRVAGTALPHLL